jgi:phosphoribosylformylglycinamidine (FGAM) synthase-like enzyme
VRVRTSKGVATKKALAITTDCTPRYCFADPVEGGKQAVAETWRNLTAVGATPLAITNCLNFGNPEKPEIMGQIVGCLQGMAEACRALDYPIISGNVSLYNETQGKGIFPTPAIGGVGILKDVEKRAGGSFVRAGEDIILIGETKGHLGCSLYLTLSSSASDSEAGDLMQLDEIPASANGLARMTEYGPPPPVDLNAEKKNGDFVRGLIAGGSVSACHDVSDGGLLVALAEMTYANDIGAVLTPSRSASPHDLPPTGGGRSNSTSPRGGEVAERSEAGGGVAFWFGEDQGRYILAVDTAKTKEILAQAAKAGVAAVQIGKTQASTLEVSGQFKIAVSELRAANEKWLPEFMA